MKRFLGLIIVILLTLGFSQSAYAVFTGIVPPVPEPSSLSLLFVGGVCAGVAVYIRNRNRRK